MHKLFTSISLLCITLFSSLKISAQQTSFITSTASIPWKQERSILLTKGSPTYDVEIKTQDRLQTIEGFGACFNELGYQALQVLSAKDRNNIFSELFKPNSGCNFNICRTPIGANDFSLDWYSYDETDQDFQMKDFSVSHDLKTIVPFIKTALKHNPQLKIWGSPWSPPSWMKYNHHYACNTSWTGVDNGLKPNQVITEGHDAFIQQEAYFKAYALYFTKYIDAYKKNGINISMVMPQNEFNSSQLFPSCTWTTTGLATWINYLAPAMQKFKVKVFLGTVERANALLVDTILQKAGSGISGVGFQWAGKDAVSTVHQKYPNLKLYQTEQECGDGKNSWEYCLHTWQLMKQYFKSGVNAYMYWNIELPEGGRSHWGWNQNSLITTDSTTSTFKYTYEFYLLKHLCHFVKPGARLLRSTGAFDDLLAFINPDGEIIVVLYNPKKTAASYNLKINSKAYTIKVAADSFNTIRLKKA